MHPGNASNPPEGSLTITFEGATDAKLGVNCSYGYVTDSEGEILHYCFANPGASIYNAHGITEGFCGDKKYYGSFSYLHKQIGDIILDNCTYTTEIDEGYLTLQPFFEFCDEGWCH